MHEEIQHVWIINWLRVEQNTIYTNGARGMLIGNVKACMILYVGGFIDQATLFAENFEEITSAMRHFNNNNNKNLSM